LFIIVL
jgi:hypothetical protein